MFTPNISMKPNASPVALQETFVETLEARIAPASMNFTDADGDIITVTTTKGTADDIFGAVTGGNNAEIQKIDLHSNSVFAGTSIKVFVSGKAAGGDGMANVWWVDAAGVDVGNVEVVGDLAKLTAGDTNYATKAANTIKVQSVGVNGGAMAKDWLIAGNTMGLTVAGDVKGAALSWIVDNNHPGQNISAGNIKIGGSLIGGGADNTGLIKVRGGDDTGGKISIGEIKSLSIGGSLISTAYAQSGAVIVGDEAMADHYKGVLGKTTIGGSLQGFTAKNNTGVIFASSGSIGDVSVGQSLLGTALHSGSIYSYQGTIGAVVINGSLEGGAGQYSGSVFADFAIKSVSVGGSMTGGNGAFSGSIISGFGAIGDVRVGSYIQGGSGIAAGTINGETAIGNIFVGGSVFGGSNDESGSIFTNTGAGYKIGNIDIRGSLFGGSDFTTGIIKSGQLGAVSISGSLESGTVGGTGSIYASETATSVYIGGDIKGGAMNNYSGAIRIAGAAANVSSITVGHDLIGGAGGSSGAIEVAGKVGKLVIGGEMIGAAGAKSGSVQIGGDAGSVTVGGDITGGNGNLSANLTVGGNTGSFSIGGNIVGNPNMAVDSGHVIFQNIGTGFVGGSLVGGMGTESGGLEFANGKSLKIIGGVLGGDGNYSGSLQFISLTTLDVGTIDVNGNSLYGGGGEQSGCVLTHANTAADKPGVKKASFAGSFFGGSGQFSGAAVLTNVGDVTVGGDMIGGSAKGTGRLGGVNATGKVTINGSVIGGVNNSDFSGQVTFVGNVKSLEIKGSVIGGTATMANVAGEGGVYVFGHVNSLTIGGDVKAGTAFDKTNYGLGTVGVGTADNMLIKGSVIGNNTLYAAITARGDVTKTSGANLAIKSLTINGSTSYANILGGYDVTGNMLDGAGGNDGGSAQLGTVTVLGDFHNSTIATGVSNNNANPNHWADGANELLPKPAGSNIVASIAKIVIKGASFANVQNGFAAQQVKSLNIGGFNIPVPAGAQNFQVSGGNYKVQQVVA